MSATAMVLEGGSRDNIQSCLLCAGAWLRQETSKTADCIARRNGATSNEVILGVEEWWNSDDWQQVAWATNYCIWVSYCGAWPLYHTDAKSGIAATCG